MKNVVEVTFKNEPVRTEYFKTCKDLFNKYTTDELGCVIGTLWNNIRKKQFENKLIKVRKVRVVECVKDEAGTLKEIEEIL